MKHNTGGVLIYVLLLLVTLSSLLSIAFQSATNNTRLLAASLNHTEARQMALSGLDLILYELKRDGRKENTDDMSDRWYSYNDGRTFPIDGGEIYIRIQDAGALPSLNQLLGYGTSDELYQNMLKRYIAAENLPSFNLAPLLDYIDGDKDTRSSGAEAWDYLNDTPSFLPRNSKIEGYGDLSMIKDFPEKIHRQAEDYFSLLSGEQIVNVNTAHPSFLKALFPSNPKIAQATELRIRAPYLNLGDFLKELEIKKSPPSVYLSTSTEYFTVRSQVRYNGAEVGLTALIWRDELSFKVIKINWL
jgi:type II secretory pathway component PulK